VVEDEGEAQVKRDLYTPPATRRADANTCCENNNKVR
jgi:hypothetical protein